MASASSQASPPDQEKSPGLNLGFFKALSDKNKTRGELSALTLPTARQRPVLTVGDQMGILRSAVAPSPIASPH